MCICDKYGYRHRAHKETLEFYCSTCGYSEHMSIIQPTLEQILGQEEAARVRAKQRQPQVVRYYAFNGRLLGRM